jgi:hypothetical protein
MLRLQALRPSNAALVFRENIRENIQKRLKKY